MSDTSAYIRDPRSLAELSNTLTYSADSILKLLNSVKNYLSGVQEVLANQVEILANELESAEQALAEAEEDLRFCEASQEWDEEEHEYYPSCSSESSAVAGAREVRDECKRKYDEGCRIKSDCEREIKLYQRSGDILSSCGGEKLLEHLAVEHTDKATRKMQEILDAAEEMASSRVTIGRDLRRSDSVSDNRLRFEDKPLTKEDREERFKNAIQNVIERQHDKNYGGRKIADANKAMKCPKCERPILACICGMDNRVSNRIINDDFSR